MADIHPGVADPLRQDHERGDAHALRTPQVRQDRAVVRLLLAESEQPAGLHELVAGLVDRRRLVMDRADDGVAMRELSHAREELADVNAGHSGGDRPERAAYVAGRVRFGVPGVELARAADEEQEDQVDVGVWAR